MKFWAIIEILKGLLNIYHQVLSYFEKRSAEKELKRQIELNKGLEDIKTAKTDEEIFNAEEKISTNHP